MITKFGQKVSNRAIVFPVGRKKGIGTDVGHSLLVPRITEEASLSPFNRDSGEGFARAPATEPILLKCKTRGDEEAESLNIVGFSIKDSAVHILRPGIAIDDIFDSQGEWVF